MLKAKGRPDDGRQEADNGTDSGKTDSSERTKETGNRKRKQQPDGLDCT